MIQLNFAKENPNPTMKPLNKLNYKVVDEIFKKVKNNEDIAPTLLKYLEQSKAKRLKHYAVPLPAEPSAVLRSLFLDSNESILSNFLSMEEPVDIKAIDYMKIEDVLKTKGNAINGPRREDIDRFNRKLFDSHTKELESVYAERIILNLEFYPLLAINTNSVVCADLIELEILSLKNENYKFTEKSRLPNCILIIHRVNNTNVLSLATEREFIYRELAESSFEYKKRNRILDLLELSTFSIFSVKFLSAFVCNQVTERFFGTN